MQGWENIFSKSKMTSKGQLTLPKKVREYLGAETGDNIIFELVGDKLTIKKYEGIEQYFDTLPIRGDDSGEDN